MTKQTKTILGVGALALVGYFVWKKMSGTKANASGKLMGKRRPKVSVGNIGNCQESCDNGQCKVDVYNDRGGVDHTEVYACTGTRYSDIGKLLYTQSA